VAQEATKRLQLGQALAAARKGAGITQQRAANAIGCTQPKINKIETTTCTVTRNDLDNLLRVYDPPEEQRQRILQLAAESRPGPSAGIRVNRDYLKLLDLERQATEVLVLHAERIPNLLQSEHYMLMQHKAAGHGPLDPIDMARILQDRQEREQLFTTARPPRYRALFSVSAFHRMPDGRTAELVIDQAQHLLMLADKYPSHLTIQVIPWRAKLPYLPHDLTVLRFADPKDDQVYSEYGIGESRIYSGKKQVTAHIAYWTMAHDAALTVEETRKFLHDLIVEARSW
jgi:transcriptional regulator with XRE-family HTH domain